jgi:drug/metabolite transporter (DMT)-like permease
VLAVGQVSAVAAAGLVVALLGAPVPAVGAIASGLAAGAANGLALLAMFECAQHLRLSVMAPIGAAGGAVPVVVALLLGERPAPWQLAGIPLALVGVVLVAAGQDGGSGADPPGGQRTLGLWLAAVWALLYGVFLSLFAESVAAAGPGLDGEMWAVLTSRVSLLLTVVAVPLARRSRLRLSRSAVPVVTLNGLLILGGVISFAGATSVGLVSVVSVLATLSPLVTVALAVVVLHERLGSGQQAGLATATAGVVLLSAG